MCKMIGPIEGVDEHRQNAGRWQGSKGPRLGRTILLGKGTGVDDWTLHLETNNPYNTLSVVSCNQRK